MTSNATSTQPVTKLGNGVEVQNIGIPLEGKRKQVVEDVLNLYSAQANPEIFRRSWREDSTFIDPFSKCYGYQEYAGQWYGLPKIFSDCRTLAYEVISSTQNPNRIDYNQKQQYTFRGIGSTYAIDSNVTLELDENDKIVRLDDKWNGNDQPDGFAAERLRRLNTVVVPHLIDLPKWESE